MEGFESGTRRRNTKESPKETHHTREAHTAPESTKENINKHKETVTLESEPAELLEERKVAAEKTPPEDTGGTHQEVLRPTPEVHEQVMAKLQQILEKLKAEQADIERMKGEIATAKEQYTLYWNAAGFMDKLIGWSPKHGFSVAREYREHADRIETLGYDVREKSISRDLSLEEMIRTTRSTLKEHDPAFQSIETFIKETRALHRETTLLLQLMVNSVLQSELASVMEGIDLFTSSPLVSVFSSVTQLDANLASSSVRQYVKKFVTTFPAKYDAYCERNGQLPAIALPTGMTSPKEGMVFETVDLGLDLIGTTDLDVLSAVNFVQLLDRSDQLMKAYNKVWKHVAKVHNALGKVLAQSQKAQDEYATAYSKSILGDAKIDDRGMFKRTASELQEMVTENRNESFWV